MVVCSCINAFLFKWDPMRTPVNGGVRIGSHKNAYMHEQITIKFGVRIVGRKNLNWCTPFCGVSLCYDIVEHWDSSGSKLDCIKAEKPLKVNETTWCTEVLSYSCLGFSSREDVLKFFKVVLGGYHRNIFGVKVKTVKLIGGRRYLAVRSGLNVRLYS